MNLNLFNTAILSERDCKDHVNRYFESYAFRYYDDAPATPPNTILPTDICITITLNSRAGYKQVHSVIQHKANIEEALSQVPVELTLLDSIDDSMKEKLNFLFKNICVPHIRLSTGSKILHRKRPSLIPIMDRNIQHHYRSIIQDAGVESDKAIQIMGQFKNDLAQNHNLLKALIENDSRLSHVGPLRLLEALIWQMHNGDDGKTTADCSACQNEIS